MKDVLLIVLILAFFAFGYFMVDRLDRFFKEHRGTEEKQPAPDGEIYVADAAGKSAQDVSEEISLLLNDLADRDDYEIIICRKGNPEMTKYLEQSGCTVERISRQ